MGPSYACLFVGYVEQSLCICYTGTIPHLFLHCIDDSISTASCSHEELEQFINFTNTFHPNLKFTWTISVTSLPFLDLDRSLRNSLVCSTLPTNPTSPAPFPCNGRRCYTCPYISPLTFKLSKSDGFTCTSSNLANCIRCSRHGLLYIGETKCRLGDQFMEYLHSVCYSQQHLPVADHFNFPSHSLGDMSILGVLQCHNDTTCKLEERRHMQTGGATPHIPPREPTARWPKHG
eukprot:g34904.t1